MKGHLCLAVVVVDSAVCLALLLGSCGGAQEAGVEEPSVEPTTPSPPLDPATSKLQVAMDVEEELQVTRVEVGELLETAFEAEKLGDSVEVVRLRAHQKEKELEVERLREEAIAEYAALARDHQGFSKRDEVLFRLASLYEQYASDLGATVESARKSTLPQRTAAILEKARATYRELIKSYPMSERIPNAYLSFAEHYFSEADMTDALLFYERVTMYEDSDVYGYAMYKTAWCHTNLQQDRDALEAFVRTIQWAEENPQAQGARQLSRQARRELLRPFSRVSQPAKALEFFRRVGGGHELEMMEQLAEHYFNSGMFRDARTSYRALMTEAPGSHRICFYQRRVADCTRQGSPREEIVRETRRTVDLISAFVQGAHPEDVERECRQSVAQLVLEQASTWHRDGLATRDVETMNAAVLLYNLALDNISDIDQLRLEGWSHSNRPTADRVRGWIDELRQAGATASP